MYFDHVAFADWCLEVSTCFVVNKNGRSAGYNAMQLRAFHNSLCSVVATIQHGGQMIDSGSA
jgi:hypothetical protein